MPVKILVPDDLPERLERNWARFGFAAKYSTPRVFGDAGVTEVTNASLKRLCKPTVDNLIANQQISFDEATHLFTCTVCSGVEHVLKEDVSPEGLKMEFRAVLILAILMYEEILRNGNLPTIYRNGSYSFFENHARKLARIHGNGGFGKDCKGALLRQCEIMLNSLYDTASRRACFPVKL